jgi:hypothetical protein
MARHVYTFTGKGLTFVQPWANAVAFAGKDIENRSWRTHYRGPLALHAGGSAPDDVLEELTRAERGGPRRTLLDWVRRGRRRYDQPADVEEVPGSCIVAIAMLVDCVERSSYPWFGGEYGWVLSGVVPIEPIPMTGGLSLWDCEFEYIPLARRQKG